MKLPLSTFFAGLLFGAGLTISQMINPAKVIAFLDVTGQWDPSLAFVMGGALLVTFIGYKLVLKRKAPFFEGQFRIPTRKDIDSPLILGSALFGIGWGAAGLCPGPALAILGVGGFNAVLFTSTMVATIAIYRFIRAYQTSS